MIRGLEDLHIGNINSPNQVILSGNTETVKNLGGGLKEKGYRFTLLRVSMAFHSPIMRVIHDELEAFVASIPFHSPQIPVISNTTLAPYPSDPAEIRRILMAHLESPVHWMNNVQTLWNDYGIRHFVEVGPGDILSGLIADTLPEPLCFQTCLPTAESHTYQTALAQLFVHGHLQIRGEPQFISLPSSRKAPASHRPPARSPAIPDRPAAPALAEAPECQDHLEAVIRIIMSATGFNRDEIQPDMDLRRDLSVRSSRLPIIMDAAERQFGITLELEDFIDVRTVMDIALRISGIIAAQGGAGLQPGTGSVDAVPERDTMLTSREDGSSLKRLVFDQVSADFAASVPIELKPGESVLLLSPDSGERIAESAGEILRLDHGVD